MKTYGPINDLIWIQQLCVKIIKLYKNLEKNYISSVNVSVSNLRLKFRSTAVN